MCIIKIDAVLLQLGMWHGIRIKAFRDPAGVIQPQAMAEQTQIVSASPEIKKKMYLNNCAQRAHVHYIENQGSVVTAMMIAGLQYPSLTTLMGLGWIIGRILYATGYTKEDEQNGNGRFAGLWFSAVFQVGLFGLASWSGLRVVL